MPRRSGCTAIATMWFTTRPTKGEKSWSPYGIGVADYEGKALVVGDIQNNPEMIG